MSENLNIAYLGPEATFTHQAAVKAFGEKAGYSPAETIDEIFSMVQDDRAQRGVAPVENSNEGVVTSTMDLLVDSTLVISGEIILPIRLMLLARENDISSVSTVYSHPQALAQCRKWLKKHLPYCTSMDTKSTSEAAYICTQRDRTAAIAGELAGELYGLRVLARDIGDWEENLTRFLVFSKHPAKQTGNDKTSVVFSIKDRVGALYEMLKPFHENGINLTKIESRPSKKKAWDYLFFIDFEGHCEDEIVKNTLSSLADLCPFLKVLGSYPVGGK